MTLITVTIPDSNHRAKLTLQNVTAGYDPINTNDGSVASSEYILFTNDVSSHPLILTANVLGNDRISVNGQTGTYYTLTIYAVNTDVLYRQADFDIVGSSMDLDTAPPISESPLPGVVPNPGPAAYVSKTYVDTGDATTLAAAKAYTDAHTPAGATEIYFNVKDYGAFGDGITDDHDAVQSAIDAACANSAQHVTVYFPAGVYHVGKPVRVYAPNVTLLGEGRYASTLSTWTFRGPVLVVLPSVGTGFGQYPGIPTAPALVGSGVCYSPAGTVATEAFDLRETSHLDIDGATAFTIEFWFNAASDTALSSDIMSCSGSLNDQNSHLTLQFAYDNHATLTARADIGGVLYSISGSASVSTTYHVALTYDGSVLRLFLNGTLASSQSVTGTLVQKFYENWQIGFGTVGLWPFSTCANAALKGQIDSIRVSNIARYTSSFSVPTSKLTSDANTLFLQNWDNIWDMFAVATTPDGPLYMPYHHPTFGANNAAVLGDIALKNIGFGSYVLMNTCIEANIDDVYITAGLYGLYLQNNCYLSQCHRLKILGQATTKCDLAMGPANGLIQFDSLELTSGQCHIIGISSSGVFNNAWIELNSINRAIAQFFGPGTWTFNGGSISFEDGSSSSLIAGVGFNGLNSVLVNALRYECDRVPPFHINGGQSHTFNTISVAYTGNGSHAEVINVGTAPTTKILVLNSNQIGFDAWSADTTDVVTLPSGGAGSSTLAGDTDVTITSPANNDVLTYDSASGKWKNLQPTGGGGGGVTANGVPVTDLDSLGMMTNANQSSFQYTPNGFFTTYFKPNLGFFEPAANGNPDLYSGWIYDGTNARIEHIIRGQAILSISYNSLTPATGGTIGQGNNYYYWGNVDSNMFRLRNTQGESSNVYWSKGTGSPEGVVTADVGSMYARMDGGSSTTLYIKESGTGNTGWTAYGLSGGIPSTPSFDAVNLDLVNQDVILARDATTGVGSPTPVPSLYIHPPSDQEEMNLIIRAHPSDSNSFAAFGTRYGESAYIQGSQGIYLKAPFGVTVSGAGVNPSEHGVLGTEQWGWAEVNLSDDGVYGHTTKIKMGTGDPEGVITANQGSMFIRKDGGAGTTLYMKESGNATNTGWVAYSSGGGGGGASLPNTTEVLGSNNVVCPEIVAGSDTYKGFSVEGSSGGPRIVIAPHTDSAGERAYIKLRNATGNLWIENENSGGNVHTVGLAFNHYTPAGTVIGFQNITDGVAQNHAGVSCEGSFITWRHGSPEGGLPGNPGSLCLSLDGGSGTTLYVKESGTGTNTGWTAVSSGGGGGIPSGTGSPEGVVTGTAGDLYRQTDNTTPGQDLFYKTTNTGNTGWVNLLPSRFTAYDDGSGDSIFIKRPVSNAWGGSFFRAQDQSGNDQYYFGRNGLMEARGYKFLFPYLNGAGGPYPAQQSNAGIVCVMPGDSSATVETSAVQPDSMIMITQTTQGSDFLGPVNSTQFFKVRAGNVVYDTSFDIQLDAPVSGLKAAFSWAIFNGYPRT